MRIALGADHGGFDLKELLTIHLKRLGHEVLDVGTSSREAVDYPTFARAVADEVASGRCDRGIMLDGAGIGSAMAANKVPGIRAAMVYDLTTARNSREHNNSNVLTLGAGLIGPRLAEQIVSLWLTTDCTEERHLRRVAQIEGTQPASVPRTSARSSSLRAPSGSDVPHGIPADVASSAGLPGGGISGSLSDEDLERIAQELRKMIERGSSMTIPPLPPPSTRRQAGPENIARYLDHTILRPDATADEIRNLCAEARQFSFAAVCVNPIWTRLAAKELAGTSVKVCVVAGFPFGATPAENKALEARRAIREGAKEVDMVINVGALKGGDDATVLHDIRAVVEACRDGGAICKVIIEASLLTDEEKRLACRLSRRARAHFVKTSTGFGPGGATTHDVALMAAEVADAGIQVKAAGGIRTFVDAVKMIEAGATRIGTSRGVAIVQESRGAATGG
jgi:deoxyribose-phosphate aldolase